MHINSQGNLPAGYPTNAALAKTYPFDEDTWCGQPDLVEVGPVPTSGPPGSTRALYMGTTFSATNAITWERDGVGWLTDRTPLGWPLSRRTAYSVNVYVPPLSTWSLRVPSVTNSYVQGRVPSITNNHSYKFYWGPHVTLTGSIPRWGGTEGWYWYMGVYLTDGNATVTGCAWTVPVWIDGVTNWTRVAKAINPNGEWWTLGVTAYNNPINGATQLNDVAWFAHPGVTPLTRADFWTNLNYGQAWGDVLSFREFNIGVYTQHGTTSEVWALDNLLMLRPRTPALLRIR
jgi:hypothetical protein